MNNNLMILRKKDLISNPTTRLPVCLCLDTSSSMSWGSPSPIDELNKGVELFVEAIKNDEVARYSVELSVVTFDSQASLLLDFANIDRQDVPHLNAEGWTCMGGGVNMALDMLESRKSEYSEKGVDYYQPWLVLMSDGVPTDDISNAVNRVRNLSDNKKLTVFAVGVGKDSDINTLKGFSSLKDNLVLKVTSAEYFREFFEWLSQSVSVVSQSVPGDNPKLPPTPSVIEIQL